MKSLKTVEGLIHQQAEDGFISGDKLHEIVPTEFRNNLADGLNLNCVPMTDYARTATTTHLWWPVETVIEMLEKPIYYISGDHKKWANNEPL